MKAKYLIPFVGLFLVSRDEIFPNPLDGGKPSHTLILLGIAYFIVCIVGIPVGLISLLEAICK